MKRLSKVPISALAAGVAAVVVAAMGVIVATPAAHAQSIDPNAWYEIVSRHSGKAIDVCGMSTADSACVQQWGRNNQANQQFRFVSSGSGYYRIQARHSGKVLDVYEWNPDNGAEIRQWADLNGANQQFQVIDVGGGYVKLINRFSGKALDVWEWSTADGGRISQFDDIGGVNQQWQLVSVGSQQPPGDGRLMENLGRGVVAVRSGNTVLVSWRLFGLDPAGIGFNVYRSAGGGAEVRLNSSVLTGGTNFVDSTANLSQANTYRVRPVVGGVEQAPSGSFTLTANHATEPVVRVPLRNGGTIQFAWVGDLDGDGEYDYVVDRLESPQRIEAYRSNGQFLWEVNLGPNSLDDAGSARISDGHWDGVTVYDFDSDGRAEVALKIANGVRFGNGATYNGLPDNTRQAIAILDGMTGAARATAPIPTDYISAGRMNARFAVGYLDGVNPSLVAYMKNRVGTGPFNLIMAAWRFNGSSLTQQWKWLRGDQDAPDGHNTRVIDVDGDGRDEVVEIGFVLNGDGTVRYLLGPSGIVHGDRFHIADMDPNRPGLEGYGVQQDNPSGLLEYYYAASNGSIIWRHGGGPADVGRGVAGDVDPRSPGMEVWSFSGVYNAPTNQRVSTTNPWPQMGIYWDGDTTMELHVDGQFNKWNPASSTSSRLVTTWQFGAITGPRSQPAFVGDILGDWREEAVFTNGGFNELIVFTTNQPTNTRLYTLAHNPAYRNDMTVKGYMQDHHVDYFLGNGMAPPPRPNITYAGG